MATRVNIVENLLEAFRENVFVAVNIQGYKNLPVIGKVRSVNAEDSSFDVKYWKGSWKKGSKPWKLSNGELWTDRLLSECILLVAFKLNDTNKLPYETYRYLRDTYQELERNQPTETNINCKLCNSILLTNEL